MNLNNAAAAGAARELTTFVADLTDAAYGAVLRHGISGSWIDLQLDVWKALAASVTQTGRTASPPRSALEFLAWREAFLSELTDAAYHTALQHGLLGRFLDLELDLHLALREVLERSQSETGLYFIFAASTRAIADAVLERFEHQSFASAETDWCHR
jgi:hypothetical protein